MRCIELLRSYTFSKYGSDGWNMCAPYAAIPTALEPDSAASLCHMCRGAILYLNPVRSQLKRHQLWLAELL
jgi:hypothetical protein